MSDHKVAVIGGGSFGTVIANIIAENGYDVSLWMRSDGLVSQVNIERENKKYLPGLKLNERLIASKNMPDVVADCDLIFVAVPSTFFRAVVKQMKPLISSSSFLVSTTKGIEAKSFFLMSQILQEEFPEARVGVMSGPNLAKEIASKNLTGTVIASHHQAVLERVKEVLRSEYFRVYTSDDMFGVELGGSLKNIYAIIAGVAAALGMGHNTNSMLVTRSLAEMARFGQIMGADPMTFLGLAGVGDLVVTCSTPLSRNYRFGLSLGKGARVDQAVRDIGQVVEGVNTVKLVKEKADELGVYMPLASGLYRIIYDHQNIGEIISSLMLGEQTQDVEFAAGKVKRKH